MAEAHGGSRFCEHTMSVQRNPTTGVMRPWPRESNSHLMLEGMRLVGEQERFLEKERREFQMEQNHKTSLLECTLIWREMDDLHPYITSQNMLIWADLSAFRWIQPQNIIALLWYHTYGRQRHQPTQPSGKTTPHMPTSLIPLTLPVSSMFNVDWFLEVDPNTFHAGLALF